MQSELKLMQFNLENFFLYLDHYQNQDFSKISESEWQKLSSSSERLKPLRKIWQIASILTEEKPDVVVLNEVGGHESLSNFCKYFLNDGYKPYLIEGNSDRGIDIGFLVKKDFGSKNLLITHKNRPIQFLYQHEQNSDKKSHYFSRDVAELRLFKNEEAHSPSLIILGVHLKSKLDPQGVDPQGRSRRAAELKTLVEIYNEIKLETRDEIPILVAGDFNGVAGPENTEEEFKYLYEKSDLQDAISMTGVLYADRYTQIVFDSLHAPRPIQIDYFFIAHKFSTLVVKEKSAVYRYRMAKNIFFKPPTSI